MNKQQKTYSAFIESICNKFNCPEMAPALKEGFQAFCEAMDYDGSVHSTTLPFIERVNTFEEIINTLGTDLVDETWVSNLIEKMRTLSPENRGFIERGPRHKEVHNSDMTVDEVNHNIHQDNYRRADERLIKLLRQAGIPAKLYSISKRSRSIAVAIDEQSLDDMKSNYFVKYRYIPLPTNNPWRT